MAQIEHELGIRGLFALAYANEYPVKVQDPDGDHASAEPEGRCSASLLTRPHIARAEHASVLTHAPADNVIRLTWAQTFGRAAR